MKRTVDHPSQVTRLIPEARGTKCNQELEPILGTAHSFILRVPFKTENGVLQEWVSRFDIYPYLERYAQVRSCFLRLILLLSRELSRFVVPTHLWIFLAGCYCQDSGVHGREARPDHRELH